MFMEVTSVTGSLMFGKVGLWSCTSRSCLKMLFQERLGQSSCKMAISASISSAFLLKLYGW